jgi:hypothetical protein
MPSAEEGETTELQAAHLHPLRSGKAYFCASLPSARTRRNTRDQPATPGNHLQHINQNLRTQNRLKGGDEPDAKKIDLSASVMPVPRSGIDVPLRLCTQTCET